jgi:hypothetical protein
MHNRHPLRPARNHPARRIIGTPRPPSAHAHNRHPVFSTFGCGSAHLSTNGRHPPKPRIIGTQRRRFSRINGTPTDSLPDKKQIVGRRFLWITARADALELRSRRFAPPSLRGGQAPPCRLNPTLAVTGLTALHGEDPAYPPNKVATRHHRAAYGCYGPNGPSSVAPRVAYQRPKDGASPPPLRGGSPTAFGRVRQKDVRRHLRRCQVIKSQCFRPACRRS